MSNPPTMKSSSYSVVPLESIDLTIPECDVTDVNRRATPGKFIDCLIISDNSNKMGLRYTSRPLSLGSGEDRANMQIVGGKGFAHLGQFSDETLMVDPESGAIIPVMTSPEKTTPAPSTKSHANSESSMSSSSSSSDQFGVDLKEPENQLTARKLFVTLLLFFINLINYIDRYTTAGVLKEIIAFYKISKSQAGLLQTVFIVAYMFLAPVFGYLGDRYNRVVILIFGITFWSGTTLLGSFVPQDYFLYFLLLRGAVGIGEASYSTVAPTIIADLFSKQMRTTMLTLFYFAIPVGSGLGYIIGSHVKDAFGAWQWALRVTPLLGIISVILLCLFVREPERGQSDGSHQLQASSWGKDLVSLLKNKSFMLSTWGFTAVSFVAGALAYWTPFLTQLAYVARGEHAGDVALIFGAITVAAGIVGVVSGVEIARRWKEWGNQAADALVCAAGLLICAPFMLAAILTAMGNVVTFWVLIAVAEVFLCLNWAVVADILFYVVIPTRRSTAEAFQILLSHLFGDAGSPYLIGLVSDSLKNHTNNSTLEAGQFNSTLDAQQLEALADFEPLQSSLYMTVVACVLGGIMFLVCSLFIVEDKTRAERLTKLNELGVMEAVEDGEENALKHFPIDVVIKDAGRQKDFLLPPKLDRLGQLRNDSQCSTQTAMTDNSDV